MNLHKLIFTENDCYKTGRKMKPHGIMVHSTGSNNPWLNRYVAPDDGLLGKNRYGNHWNQAMDRHVCVHGFIGKLADGTIATYQTLPWDHFGWHAGGSANGTHIGFEICEDGLKDPVYFAAVYKEAVELCAYLCKLYGLAVNTIICHSEGHARGIASNHADVMHWFPKHGKSMDTFRADVKKLLESDTVEPPTKEEPEVKPAEKPATVKIDGAKSFSTAKKGKYRVKSSDGTLNLRSGASAGKRLIETMPNGTIVRCYGYHTGDWLYVVSAAGNKGYCHGGYLEKV